MASGTVMQRAIAKTPTCSFISAGLVARLYALKHVRDTVRKTAHVYVATTSREALSAIEKGQRVRVGRSGTQGY